MNRTFVPVAVLSCMVSCASSFEYEPCTIEEARLVELRLCDGDPSDPVNRAQRTRDSGGVVAVVSRSTALSDGAPKVFREFEPWLAQETRTAEYEVLDPLGGESTGVVVLSFLGGRLYYISESGEPLCGNDPNAPFGAPCLTSNGSATSGEMLLVFVDADGLVEHWCVMSDETTARCTEGEVEVELLRR